MISAVYIGGLGLLGVILRYGVDQLLWTRSQNFPISTLLVNLVGCGLAGFFWVLGEKQILSPSVQLGLLAGFCGGFTTFSAYALQSFRMFEKGHMMPALIYFGLSPIMGFFILLCVTLITRKVF